MNHRHLVLLAIFALGCSLASAAAARGRKCGGGRGVCRKAGSVGCQEISAGSCSPGFTCCQRGNPVKRKLAKDPTGSRGSRRKCKTKRKCSKHQGTCINPMNDACVGLGVSSLCKGGSCTCCISGEGKSTCKSRPSCRFRGGVCVNSKKANSLCKDATIDKKGCRGRKCSCCIPKENSCMCGMANGVLGDNMNSTESTNSTTPAMNTTMENPSVIDILKPSEPQLLTKVIGGTELKPQQLPWLVGFEFPSPEDFSYCSGAIINDYYVLTTASCVVYEESENVRVIIADFNQSSTEDDIPGVTRSVEIEEYIIHEDYDFIELYNDIALVKLKEPLDLVSHNEIKPVCLPTEDEDFAGEEAIIAGWGWDYGVEVENEYSLSDTPSYARLTILDEECNGLDVLNSVFVTENNLCAEVSSGEGRGCYGDSGAPLTVERDGRHILVGLHGDFVCSEEDEPDLYMRVSKYLKWIFNNIDRESSFCG